MGFKIKMAKSKKINIIEFEFNEAQGRGAIIAGSIQEDMKGGTNPDLYECGEVNTRYSVTIKIKELGDWNKT